MGAKGEVKVATELARLSDTWHWLHAVEVGDRGSAIDHVVIGPPGVFTLNTKRHPGGKAWVGERAVVINGQRTDYLRNSRFEGKCAAELLSKARGCPVAVTPVIVFVDLDEFNVKQFPADVHVTTRKGLLDWFSSIALRSQVESGGTVYRQGVTGTQHTADGQFWAGQNPASTPGYADSYGTPGTQVAETSILESWVGRSTPVPRLLREELPALERTSAGLRGSS